MSEPVILKACLDKSVKQGFIELVKEFKGTLLLTYEDLLDKDNTIFEILMPSSFEQKFEVFNQRVNSL